MGTPVYWPEALGDIPIQYGMQRTLADETNYDETEVDAGEKRRRLKYVTTISKLSITFAFNDARMQEFVAFYMNDLYKGTKAFLARVPYPGGARVFRCRFDPTTYKDSAETYNRWSVSVTMEVRDIATWGAGAQWLIDLFGGDEQSVLDLSADIHTLMHTTYPTAVRDDMYV